MNRLHKMSTTTKKSLTYQKLSQYEHVLLRSDMYIGSTHAAPVSTYVADTCSHIIGQSITLVEGLVRIFIEPLSNAVDNVIRSRELEINPKYIRVTADSTRITIENDGYAIPIKYYHDSHDSKDGVEPKTYIPQLLFGQLLTSSNYDDTEQRYTSGKNGVGVSITNIFSSSFEIECGDPVSGLLYTQNWTNNMTVVSPPHISKYKKKTGYTRVSYVADFARFGVDGYSPSVLTLFRRLVMDCAMLSKLDTVMFNDEKIPIRSLLEYAKLFEGVIHDEMQYVRNDDHIEYVIGSSIGTEHVSFVNGIHTTHGGIHVDAVCNAIFRPLAEKLGKRVKTIAPKDLKPMYTLWVNARVPNPEFTSQNKTRLVAPPLPNRIEPLTPHIQSKILKWTTIMAQIDDWVRIKELTTYKKAEKKSNKTFKAIAGYDPANLCKKRSGDCVLIVCEGLSAKTFAVTGITVGIGSKKGRDYWGIYALRGKMLNTRNASSDQISKNREIVDLIQILNLKFDADYSQDDQFKSLNYGQVLMITDQDTDGFHISGLVMNFFHSLFPTLFYRPGFLASMFTPIMNLYPSSSPPQRFYNLAEAQAALASLPKNTPVKYLKGLGSSNDDDIRQTFGKVVCTYTITSKETVTREMEKVFHDKLAEQRKAWLQNFDPSQTFVATSAPFEDFLNIEMIKYSMDDCMRNLPNVYDGLKQSQRKILFAFLQKGSEMKKVSQWAGFVSERTSYHHGEQCLFDTIIKMAQEFPGSNNIPLLAKDGQFGSRLNGGKDAASARYIFAKLAPIVKYIFRSEDMHAGILTFKDDDGTSIEPINYAPIIPMLLVNGSTAIATGWSTNIPSFNPLDLIQVLRARIIKGDDSTHELVPWYRGFKGTIRKESEKRFITRGRIQSAQSSLTRWRIVELPIGTWIDPYKLFLEQMQESKKIKTLANHCTSTDIRFDIETTESLVNEPHETFKLETALNLGNMVVLGGDQGARIMKMASIHDMLTEFVTYRLSVYNKRKVYQLAALTAQIATLDERIRFVRMVVSRELVVSSYNKAQLIDVLECKGFTSPNDLIHIPLYELTLDHVDALVQKQCKLTEQKVQLEKTEPQELWLSELTELEIELKKL